jgi:hypothetical protein
MGRLLYHGYRNGGACPGGDPWKCAQDLDPYALLLIDGTIPQLDWQRKAAMAHDWGHHQGQENEDDDAQDQGAA